MTLSPRGGSPCSPGSASPAPQPQPCPALLTRSPRTVGLGLGGQVDLGSGGHKSKGARAVTPTLPWQYDGEGSTGATGLTGRDGRGPGTFWGQGVLGSPSGAGQGLATAPPPPLEGPWESVICVFLAASISPGGRVGRRAWSLDAWVVPRPGRGGAPGALGQWELVSVPSWGRAVGSPGFHPCLHHCHAAQDTPPIFCASVSLLSPISPRSSGSGTSSSARPRSRRLRRPSRSPRTGPW